MKEKTNTPSLDDGSIPPIIKPTSLYASLLENRWVVLATLFFVTAAFGIPLLWRSNAFSLREKIVWSVVVVLYTIAMVALSVAILWWLYVQMQQMLQL